MADFQTSLVRLRLFRATFNQGDLVDEDSRLNADDLTSIIDAAEAFGKDAVAGDPE
ncbi:hypothetical protein [Sphingomonas melonis]|uniref:Uncharacterized protein n=1 Tax=Sphingomonas melonis TaxID=152682 RepID=A0A7Y9K1R1_9SPHN|nr:hypothetical protein [Sphingomonas melonis]NYD89164.1 hypothetical protein [Sphingomonas melonis]